MLSVVQTMKLVEPGLSVVTRKEKECTKERTVTM